MALDRDLLIGRWVHSYEEDAPGRRVFRPAETTLPRSRGRRSLELREDGSLVEGGPGPTDAPEELTGTWDLTGSRLAISSPRSGDSVLEVVAVEPDRLVIGD